MVYSYFTGYTNENNTSFKPKGIEESPRFINRHLRKTHKDKQE